MIKLIASDLDGTLLLNKAQTLPDDLFPLIRELNELGIHNICKRRKRNQRPGR